MLRSCLPISGRRFSFTAATLVFTVLLALISPASSRSRTPPHRRRDGSGALTFRSLRMVELQQAAAQAVDGRNA